ncbi:helix-turn-helix domain-containing protein [Streptosporangium sp. NBC_01639]|uniref:helix-turn-helix domain-containing protein n=1 Tax=unclassified Streptosporangium TaxID=2632669 RepID=UPI002DDB7069|nr:helix-turn-helix transcriptional regulator [Streptosporangium sp. NBC_01756]WSC84550.1 helix-turn-helix domain-containing protein [Streptosporangium sp. NBC_01756]WTD56817.1 helix-turn-helix domain-containing protein [Streptosporangium sp. NBC_01639]
MPKESDLYPSESPTALFGFELRRHRKARGWSQIRLSKAIPYSVGTISMIETASRGPSEEFARHCDEALEAEGALIRLWPMVSHTAAPTWFRPWLDVEATAEALRSWEPLVVPGLLQTEDYARAILNGDIGVTPEQTEEQVTARMERQNILKRAKPPLYWVVIDEAVLHRPIGSPAVMAAQITRLLEAGQAPRVTIQVLPLKAYSTTGLAGGFAIAQTQGVFDTAYVESAGVMSRVTERPEDVSVLAYRYDGIRSEALSQRESLELIKETLPRWTS